MKKSLIALVCFAVLLLSILPGKVAAVAEKNDMPVVSAEQVKGICGQIIDVNISIANNSGILGGTFTVSWSAELELIDTKQQETLGDLNYQGPSGFDRTGTNFIWYGDTISDVLDGNILTLTFKVDKNAVIGKILPVEIVAKQVINTDKQPIEVTCVSGGVEVFYTPGDVNSDSIVDLLDVLTLVQYVSDDCKTNPDGFNISLNESAADVNDDSAINLLDVILISQYVSDDCTTNPDGYNVTLLPSTSKCRHEKMQATEAKAATCTELGNIAYWHCSKCNKYFSDAEAKYEVLLANTVLNATGHTYADDWSHDENAHWRIATCEHSSEIKDYAEHTFVDHKCSICETVEFVTVTFVDYAGSVIEMQQISYGTAATAPISVPERTGYIFDGWNTTFNTVTEDMTITAQYVKAYTVTFVDHDGSILKRELVKSGSGAMAYEFEQSDLPPEGYNRTGWDKPFDNITEDITVRATYERKVYTVRFCMPDGTLIDTKTVEHGADIDEPSHSEWYFDWNNHRMGGFSGWDKSLKKIKKDEVIYAQYQDDFDQPVISIDTTSNSASIKLYAPEGCYLYAIDFGFNWSGNIAISDCVKNNASVLYKGNDGGCNIDYNNKYSTFHYTWTDAAGVSLTGDYTTILDINFNTDGGYVVNKEVLELFSNCTIIFGSEPKANIGNLQTITPIIVIK